VEHDFIMATYLADQVVVFEGIPGVNCIANKPQALVEGMNKFLGIMSVTFRRDPSNFRSRINKLDSNLDREQKVVGNYFCLEDWAISLKLLNFFKKGIFLLWTFYLIIEYLILYW